MPLVLGQADNVSHFAAITEITGTRYATMDDLASAIPRLRDQTKLPVVIGFGVRTSAQVSKAAHVAEAAVVASIFIEALGQDAQR